MINLNWNFRVFELRVRIFGRSSILDRITFSLRIVKIGHELPIPSFINVNEMSNAIPSRPISSPHVLRSWKKHRSSEQTELFDWMEYQFWSDITDDTRTYTDFNVKIYLQCSNKTSPFTRFCGDQFFFIHKVHGIYIYIDKKNYICVYIHLFTKELCKLLWGLSPVFCHNEAVSDFSENRRYCSTMTCL